MYLDELNRPIIQFYTIFMNLILNGLDMENVLIIVSKCTKRKKKGDPPLTRRIRHISEERLVHFSQISLHFLSQIRKADGKATHRALMLCA